MPEGDTIYRTARALGRAMSGRRVLGFASRMAEVARADDERAFAGECVVRVESRGKWLLMVLAPAGEDDETRQRILATHMLMSGSWHVYRRGEAWQKPRDQARIVVETDEYEEAGFRVPIAKVYTWVQLRRERKIPRVEEDLLRAEFDAEAAVKRLLACDRKSVGEAMMNQRVMAGVGNVFKSEVCFVERVSPFAPVSELSEVQARALVERSRKLLQANVLENSGDRIVTYRGRQRRMTRNADPGANLWVYGRRGEACRRGGSAIERALQGDGARVTYWCPVCLATGGK